VVILIIGILAAIAIPSFINQRTKGGSREQKAPAQALSS
jgi:type II secretory pathway pseudopilin PulG